MLMSAELKENVTWFIYFLDLLWVRYNCAKFHHCRICVTDFRDGGPFCYIKFCVFQLILEFCKRKNSRHVSVIPTVNKPLLSSVYNPFPSINKKWSHSPFLIASPVHKLKTHRDGQFCLLYVSPSYLHFLYKLKGSVTWFIYLKYTH